MMCKDDRLRHTNGGLTMRAPDLGYAPRFLSIFLASAESRFDGESTLPPQAGNANCGLTQHMLHAKSSEIAKFSRIFDDSSLERV